MIGSVRKASSRPPIRTISIALTRLLLSAANDAACRYLMGQAVAGLAGQRQGDGIDVGQARQQRNQIDTGVAEPASRAFHQQENQHQQRGEAKRRAQLERVLQQGLGVAVSSAGSAQ